MAKSTRSFMLASKEQLAEERAQYDPVDFEFIDPDDLVPKVTSEPDGEKVPRVRVVTATFPGDGAMFSMAAATGMSDAELGNPAGELYAFLRATFRGDGDYEFLKKQIRLSRITLREDVLGIIADLMEEWSGHPSQQ